MWSSLDACRYLLFLPINYQTILNKITVNQNNNNISYELTKYFKNKNLSS